MKRVVPRAKSHRKQSEEPESPPRGIDGFFRRRELVIILALCILAGIRVFVFSAGFPLFGNVDEGPHYGVVLDYAEGHIPAGVETYNAVAARNLARYGSPEYLTPQERFDQGLVHPPLNQLPPRIADAIVEENALFWTSTRNGESTQPPVYYATAAAWYKLGQLLGLTDARLAYWIRFLNVLVYGLLVWTAYAFLRRLYAGNPLLYMGVPLMLAFFPQDVFYQMNNDILTPLLFTVAFYSLLRMYLEENRSYWFHLITGLSVAAVLLVKFSNATILVPMGIVALMALRKARSEGGVRKTLPRIGVMLAAAAIPVALWLIRNCVVMGELGGGYEKAEFLGWSYKPLADFFHHPIFTPAGAWTFITGLIMMFWRGEMVWHLVRMRMATADAFYIASTLLFMGAAVVALLWRREERPEDERFAGWMGISVIAVSVLMMLAMSTVWDFGHCFYPSPNHPYFTSGRLMSGVMVPFLVLYVTGLDWLMSSARLRINRLGVLLVIAALITASEIVITIPAFHSPWNWFLLS